MNREIKFRAWDKDEGEMMPMEDLLIPYNWGSISYLGVILENHRNTENYVLMQYTGLKDKNGVEIYDGDILKYRPYNPGHEKEKKINEVMWGETGDSDRWLHSKHYEWIVGVDSLADVADGDEEFECEVIGNIYENPELLNN